MHDCAKFNLKKNAKKEEEEEEKQEVQRPYRSPEYQATRNAVFHEGNLMFHMPNS
jgi:hypothetical protein